MLFVTFFNAGLRALDIRDPFNPKEIALLHSGRHREDRPALRRRGRRTSAARWRSRRNNVEVDDRGYIYIVDRANTGMHILELTGAARRVANY